MLPSRSAPPLPYTGRASEEDFLQHDFVDPSTNNSSTNNSSNGTISGLILNDDIDLGASSGGDGPPMPTTTAGVVPTNGTLSRQPEERPTQQHESEKDIIVVGVLIALIILLCLILGFLTVPTLINFFRRRIPVSQKRIDRRYETIDTWLVTKVSTYKAFMEGAILSI
jgi:hypothetical protein